MNQPDVFQPLDDRMDETIRAASRLLAEEVDRQIAEAIGCPIDVLKQDAVVIDVKHSAGRAPEPGEPVEPSLWLPMPKRT